MTNRDEVYEIFCSLSEELQEEALQRFREILGMEESKEGAA